AAHADADDYIILQNIQRPTETIAAPKCLLSDAIDFFARYFSSLFLARLTAAVFVLLLGFVLTSRGFFERTEGLSPESPWIGFGRLRIFFDHRNTNRLIRLHGGIIALRDQQVTTPAGSAFHV